MRSGATCIRHRPPHGRAAGEVQFAGLTRNASTASSLQAQTTSDDEGPCGVHRARKSMVRNWIRRIAPNELAALRTGCFECALPWYRSEGDR